MTFSTNKQKLVTVTGTAYIVPSDVSTVVFNSASNATITFPSAHDYPNREIRVINETSHTVTSSTANVIPLAGGNASNVVAPSAGTHLLKSNGTNWMHVA